jgi:hypothetical protein
MTIEIKEISVKAYNSISKIERYYHFLRRAYEIIRDEFRNKIDPETALQITVKTVNDLAGPDSIILTLFMFGTYPKIIKDSAPLPSVI